MGGDPVTNLLSQSEVVRRGAIKLVGEGPEQTVAIPQSIGGVQSKGAELLCELLCGLGRVGKELWGLWDE